MLNVLGTKDMWSNWKHSATQFHTKST